MKTLLAALLVFSSSAFAESKCSSYKDEFFKTFDSILTENLQSQKGIEILHRATYGYKDTKTVVQNGKNVCMIVGGEFALPLLDKQVELVQMLFPKRTTLIRVDTDRKLLIVASTPENPPFFVVEQTDSGATSISVSGVLVANIVQVLNLFAELEVAIKQ